MIINKLISHLKGNPEIVEAISSHSIFLDKKKDEDLIIPESHNKDLFELVKEDHSLSPRFKEIYFDSKTRRVLNLKELIIDEVKDFKLDEKYSNTNDDKKKRLMFYLQEEIDTRFIFNNPNFFNESSLDFINRSIEFNFNYEYPKYSHEFMCMYSEFISWKGYFGPAGRLRSTYYASAISQSKNADIPTFILKKYAVPNWKKELALDGGNYKDCYRFGDWAYYSMNKKLTKEHLTQFKDFLFFPILSQNQYLPWDIELFLLTNAIDCPVYDKPTWDFKEHHKGHWSIKGLLNNDSFIIKVLKPIKEMKILEEL